MWLASAGTMWMACPQIEAGNKVTSWRPAPEDTQAGIDNVQNTADQAKTIADSAQITANVAKTDSATANSKLADIASDNKFTPSEKQETKKEWDVIVSEYPKNTAQADKFGISRSTYSWVSDALNIYITPLLANLNTTSDIDGATFRAKFKSYYDARTDLLNAISSKAKELADSKTTLNEVKAGLSVTADGVTIFGDKFTVDSLLIANAIKTNSLDVGGGNFHVGRDGVLSAKGAYIEGRLAIPFVDPLLSNNQVINLDEYFNISTSSYLYPNTTLYLPSNLKYNGVTCNIYNKGMTGNNTNIVIKPTSGTLIKTFGVDSNSFKSSIQIELGGLATFYAILENNRLIWICTNYPGAINTIS